MKTNCAKPGLFRRLLGQAASATALCLLGMTASGAGFKSPVGSWDCVMSGPRDGVAVLTFFADGTFTNREILVPKPPGQPGSTTDQRNNGGTDSRNPGQTSTNSSPTSTTTTNMFGWQDTSGFWGFDTQGRVIGFFYEYITPTLQTNAEVPATTNVDATLYSAPVTNYSAQAGEFCVTQTVGANTDGTFTNVTTCYQITASGETNQLSFVGNVVPNKHLSLVAALGKSRITYNGVPDSPQPDLSGNWYGIEHDGATPYIEFFTVTRLDPSANFFEIEGSGPAYNFSGMAILTPQKKLGIVTGSVPVFGAGPDTPVQLRSMVGPANLKRFSGSLHGLKGSDSGSTSRLTYSLQHQ